jgi:AsmA protein
VHRWLLALAAAALVAAAGVAVAVYHLDAWLDANRAAIEAQAEAALGRDVAFDDVGISLAHGLAVRVDALRIGDDPAFSPEPFLVAEAVEVRMRLWPALRGRIEVERARLRAPVLTVIASAQGLSTRSLGEPLRAGPAAPDASAPEAAAGALSIALVDVEDGTLRYVDRTRLPALESVATDFDFEATGVRPGSPVSFELAAAVLGARRQNLRASGTVDSQRAGGPALDVALALAPLDVATALRAQPLASALPPGVTGSGEARLEATLRGSASDLALEGRLAADDAELRLGTGLAKPRGRPLSLAWRARRRGTGLEIERAELALDATRLSATGSVDDLAQPRLRFRATSPSLAPASFGAGAAGDALRELALEGSLALPASGARLSATLRSSGGTLLATPYRDLALEARLADGRLEVPSLRVSAYSGAISAHGSAHLREANGPSFEARLEADGVRLEQVLASASPGAPERATGRMAAHVALRGAGRGWAAIAPTLVGDGEIDVTQGMLRGVNPAASALDALRDLPVLSGKKLRRLLETHPQVFAAEDTAFERLASGLEIRDGRVFAHGARLVAPDWVITADGRWSFSGELDSKAVLAFSAALSDDVLAVEPRARFLRSARGELEFPVAVRGGGERIRVEPDTVQLARSASREVVAETLDRVMPDEATEGPAKIEDAGRELLRRGLDGLLGRPKHGD